MTAHHAIFITRKEAKALGLKRYFTGEPCIHGHIEERSVNDKRCMGCVSRRNKERRLSHPEEHRAHIARWAAKNKPRRAVTNKAWRLLDPERRREVSKAWRLANPETAANSSRRWYAANPERKLAAGRAWRKANPEAVRAIERTRRAREMGSEGRHTSADIAAIRARQFNTCAGCGVSFDFVRPTVDHIKALINGGTNWPSNIQLLCRSCNDSKGAKDMSEWYPAWDINQYVIGANNG